MIVSFFPKNYYVYVAVFTAHISGMLLAMVLGWPSTILEKLSTLDDNPLGRIVTKTEQGLLGALPTVGALFGSFISSYIAKSFGRKPTLIFEGLPLVFANLLFLFSKNIWVIYVGRFVSGLTLGSVYAINTMYTVEVAENSNRGLLGSALITFINFGGLFTLSLGAIASYEVFHVVDLVISILFIVLVIFLVPESPFYLITKSYTKAEDSLKKLRGTSEVMKELTDIKDFVEKNEKTSWREISFTKGLRRGLLIGCSLVLFQQFSGSYVITSYCQQIFDRTNESIPSALGPVILLFVLSFLSLITPAIMDKFERKTLLLLSQFGVSLSLIILGVYFFLDENGYNLDFISWFPLVFLIFFNVSFSVGLYPIPWILTGELVPMEAKEFTAFVCNLTSSITNFIFLLVAPSVIDYFGLGPTFLFFALFSVVGIVFTKFYVFEMKGKSLGEIQNILNS